MNDQDTLKRQAAQHAVRFVQSGMALGLGSGSTVRFALLHLADLLAKGLVKDIVGVASSNETRDMAQALGIALSTLDDHPDLDLTIDGADEVDPWLDCIKGGGGALLREKIIAQASRRLIIIVDESKVSPRLGTLWALPVEVIPFARRTEENCLRSLGAAVTLRTNGDGSPFFTDQNNLILDARFGPIDDVHALARRLNERAGILEHGLFLGLAHEVIVAGKDGIRCLKGDKGKGDDVG